MFYVKQFKVPSASNPGRQYVVSESGEGVWQCSCVGWTRHVPRRDCKHITWVKTYGPLPVDPMVMAIGAAVRKETRKQLRKDMGL